MRRSRDRRGRKNADRREADQGTNGGSRSQEKGTRRTVQAADGPPCGAPERDSRCTAVEPYRCKASRNQRRRRDETMKKLTLTVLAVWFAAAVPPCADARFGSGVVVGGEVAAVREYPIGFWHGVRPDALGPCRGANRTRRTIHQQPGATDRERPADFLQHRQDRQHSTPNLQPAEAAVQPLPPDDPCAADALCAISVSNF